MIDCLKDYITVLDDNDKQMIDNKVAEKGINQYLSQQLIYLDCSRVINNMRMMQTIGYPYQREITSYLYAVENHAANKQDCIDRLLAIHALNLAYEKDNPPVWYGGKKAKNKWLKDSNATKLPRRRKVVEKTIPGMGKELSNKERLKLLNANFSGLTFKIKPPKKD